ncbi:hypothetical protein BKI52_24705 [marine bacterium AO1-C]|nr:hypothetical protein BKI52_24705 [marine bacterium AO1-C]
MSQDALPTEKCPHCHETTLVLDNKCTNCGFPIKGSKEEQQLFLDKTEAIQKRVSETQSYIKWAVGLLYFIGMLYIFIFLRLNLSIETKLSGTLLGVPYIALGLIASRFKPHLIFLVALGFYLFTELVLMSWITLPITLFNQIWAKLIVVGMLVIGSIAAYYSETLKKKLPKY